MERDRDRDGRSRRYDDGEVVRYGAGESWRPTPRGDRSPRRTRSPARERPRSPPRARSPRHRSPMISGSDSYVPVRYPPRRRSRSGGDRYRRDRSRDRDSPRRRERTRSPLRRSPPNRRSPPRRESPVRENRYERPRSPRRDWDRDRIRDVDRDRDRDWDRSRNRERERESERRDERSRSPFCRERRRDRSPSGRTTPIHPRGVSYRPRSRSASRRGDRYQTFRRSSPSREPGVLPASISQPSSEKAPSRPLSVRGRSPTGEECHNLATVPSTTSKETSRNATHESTPNLPKSPPRGPAALRGPPPTGPAANRPPSISTSTPIHPAPRHHQTSIPTSHRPDSSPTNPPSGPRGYVPSTRGSSFGSRGARGGWTQIPSRHTSGSLVAQTPSTPSTIPTGPRSTPASITGSGTPTLTRPFNPPTGPSAQHGGSRQTLALSLLATMPPIIPGGKLDAHMTPLLLGVTKEIEPHYKKLKDEEEKLREELRLKQERLRRSLYTWNRLGRDARAWEIRSDLSEKSMKSLAGEGIGGAAF